MTIIYSCVSRESTVLCSHQIGSGNYEDIAESMLKNIPARNDGKRTYTSDNCMFHCIIDNGMIYMCAADESFGKRQPYAFLQEIKSRFQSGNLATRAFNARQHELDHDFNFVLSREMEKFSKKNDNMSQLRSQVDEVKGVMTQNIEKVLERGERLDDLMDKTTELEASSATFQRTSRKIRRKYWWRNTKMTIILVCVGFTVVLVIVLIILFSTHVLPPNSGATTTLAPVTTPKAAG